MYLLIIDSINIDEHITIDSKSMIFWLVKVFIDNVLSLKVLVVTIDALGHFETA